MSRNPYAKALRAKPQQIVGDKRDKTIRQLWQEEVARGILDSDRELLDKLK